MTVCPNCWGAIAVVQRRAWCIERYDRGGCGAFFVLRAGAWRLSQLVRVEAPHFVAAVAIEDPAASAPIVRYMATWSVDEILRYCASKRWRALVL